MLFFLDFVGILMTALVDMESSIELSARSQLFNELILDKFFFHFFF